MLSHPCGFPLGLALILALSAGACGYRFVGAGGGLPDDVHTVYVERFLNRTRSIGLEDSLAAALEQVLAHQKSPLGVKRFNGADAVLSGVIREYGIADVAVNRYDEVLQFEARLVVEVVLRHRQSRKALWPRQVLSLREVYPAARGAVVPTSSGFLRNTLNVEDVREMTDVRLAADSHAGARQRLIEKFTRTIQEWMAEGF